MAVHTVARPPCTPAAANVAAYAARRPAPRCPVHPGTDRPAVDPAEPPRSGRNGPDVRPWRHI
ncbi:hypothetical protein NKG94_28540 [Micromonospora sp. M12]